MRKKKIRGKMFAVLLMTLTVATILVLNTLNRPINGHDATTASAIDLSSSKLSPELKEVLGRAGTAQMIST